MNRKIDISNILSVICVLIVVLLSKTVFFGIVNEYITSGVIFLCCIALLSVAHKLYKDNIKVLLLFLGYITFLSIVHYVDLMDGTGLFLLKRVFYLLCCFCISNCIDVISFKRIYVEVMYWISVISLISKILQFLFPVQILEICRSITFPNRYIFTFFHTFGRKAGLEARNYGPFWEPGAFQIFIVLAILFMLSMNLVNKYKMTVLLITLLSTGSTTGYIEFLIILPWIFDYYELRRFSKRNIIMLFLFACLLFFLISSKTISSKFTAGNSSLRDRTIDLQYGIVLTKMHPILGFGNTSIATSNVHNIYYCNSNGILSMFFTYGIPFSIIYFFQSIKIFLKNILKANKRNAVISFLCFLAMYVGEEANALMIFWLFLFPFHDENA